MLRMLLSEFALNNKYFFMHNCKLKFNESYKVKKYLQDDEYKVKDWYEKLLTNEEKEEVIKNMKRNNIDLAEK